MDRYLVTFTLKTKGMFLNCYRWFESEDEMNKSILDIGQHKNIFNIEKYKINATQKL